MSKRFIATGEVKSFGYLKKSYEPLTCISLFSGCGGAALGLAQAGYNIRVMVEMDKGACSTLRANFTEEGIRDSAGRMKLSQEEREKYIKHKLSVNYYNKIEPSILQEDITKLSTEDILAAANLRVGEASVLEGGFPCQGFSSANNKKDTTDHTTDKRNELYKECVRVIGEALPKMFFLENVRGLVSMEKGEVMKMICKDLANCGYSIAWEVLNAADYGIPQNRHRVIIIGERIDELRFNGEENPQLHIGCKAGKINHPGWFKKKYPKKQPTLF